MNLNTAVLLYNASQGVGSGAIGVSTPAEGVISPSMKQRKGMTQVAADASPSDLASHHLWQEPSSTDVTMKAWDAKRALEKQKGRNVDPFEGDAELLMMAHRYLPRR